MRCALEAREEGARVHVTSFESLLSDPEETVANVCAFTGIDYDPDMVPREHHEVPFGSRYRNRWYPLRQNVNERYFQMITTAECEIIESVVGPLIGTLGYARPARAV